MTEWQSRGALPRDQEASSFARILGSFCQAGDAVGAAFVDREGETVDYFGRLDPFAIRVAAAEWRLILGLFRESPAPEYSTTYEVIVRARAASFLVVALDAGYALVAALPRRSFVVSRRVLATTVGELSQEAGLVIPETFRVALERWRPVTIRLADDKARPSALQRGSGWDALEVLGRYEDRDAGVRSTGYRGRLSNGEELTLVRERSGVWYVDAHQ